jgi:tetratricopeptide (TPR) repeat protein
VGAYTVSSAQGVFGNPQDDPLNNDIRIISGMLRAGDYVHAIDFLDRSSSIHGQDPRLMELYKQAFKLGKMYPQLEELIRKLIAQNPRNPILLNDLGEARFLQNDESGADSIWRQALEIGRNDEMAYRYVADTQLRYGLYDSAVEIYLTGRRNLNRSSLFSPELASIYEAQRDYARAIDEYIVQLYEAPDRIGMVSIKIRGLVEDSEDSQEIVKTLNARINDAPGRTELYEILGDLYIKLNQVDKALECFKSIGSKLNDDGQSLIRFAGRAHESRAYGTAISAIDEYFKVSKKKTFADLALLTKARAQLAAGRSEEALGIYRNLASSAVDYRIKDEAGFTSGLIYARHRDDCDSAIAVWNAMLREARDPILSNRARLETAVCKIKESDYGSAGQFLAGVAASNIPDSSVERALFLMGEIGFYSGDFKKAEDIFRQMVRQFPNAAYSNDALMRIDVISLAGGDSANFPRLASFADAMKARMTGQPVRAAEILSDSAFEGSPMAEQALFFSGISFSAGNNSEHAISALQRYIEKYPDGLYTDRAYLEIGDIYGLTPNTYPESRNAYDKILELFPNGPVTEIARQRLRLLTAPDKVG